MIAIIFEAHGTSFDNENKKASGWGKVSLSPKGKKDAEALGSRYAGKNIEVVFCSDLAGAVQTVEIAFASGKTPIVKDWRLRECNYGNFTGRASEAVEKEKGSRITTPFPNGESYEQTTARVKSFLEDLLKTCQGKTILIIGHRATQYRLENLIKRVPLKKAVTDPWQWQP